MTSKWPGVVFYLFLIAVVAGQTGCKKDGPVWNPEPVLVLKPDSGLTTQTFDFRIELANLPKSQEEFYVRWDMNGDSIWEQPFTTYPSTTFRFYQKGVHNIKAEVLTEDGQRIIINRKITVAQGYSAPHVQFRIDPPEGNYLSTFTFNADSTYDDEDPASSLLYRWDFEDDGVWDTEPTNNPVVKHRFKKALNYAVKLSVTDPTRRVSTETKTLVVNLHEDLIHPDFTWLPADGTVKDTFLLDASPSRHETDSTRKFTYSWDIASEIVYGPFTDPVFRHQFWQAGWQKVTLTATDQFGLANSITKEFFVIKENKPPEPKILVSTPYGNITTNFYLSAWPSLDDVTPPSRLLIRWDFDGDGIWDTGWSYEKQLFHQFSAPGEFWVKLEAEDEGGERATTKTRILVSPYAIQTGFIQDLRNGNYYGTVKIGEQWWMSDNLDYRTNPKMDIPMLQKCYEETTGMCNLYGALYQSARAIDYTSVGNNICPTGWRLPSKEDIDILAKNFPATGGQEAMLVGGKLGFNARFTGSGYFVWMYPPYGAPYPVFYYSGLYDEVKYMTTRTRPFQSEFMSQYYLGLQRKFNGIDTRWGNINGYYYVRCIKAN